MLQNWIPTDTKERLQIFSEKVAKGEGGSKLGGA